jgi:hypothetical protein
MFLSTTSTGFASKESGSTASKFIPGYRNVVSQRLDEAGDVNDERRRYRLSSRELFADLFAETVTGGKTVRGPRASNLYKSPFAQSFRTNVIGKASRLSNEELPFAEVIDEPKRGGFNVIWFC